jgi:hypothetical protein
MRYGLLIVGLVGALVAVAAGPAAATTNGGIYPRSGKWTGLTDHESQSLSFKVAADAKHVGKFVLHIPYTCALGTPPGVITYTQPNYRKINAYNGYFSVSDDNLTAPGLSNDISVQFNGFFSEHGRRASKASGAIGVDFDTLDGDSCNDRFDSWTGSR